MRLCAALRPEGIQWPVNDEGKPSFRLEHLTAANHIEQKGAHDALVDVRATIDLAQLISQKQSKLFEWALKCRSKHFVSEQLAVGSFKPVLHVSGMIKSEYYHASLLLPLAVHPKNNNAVICYDLRFDPADFLNLSVDQIRQRVYAKSEELGDTPRIALKNIHLNKCPMIAPVSMFDDEVSRRIQLDKVSAREHYQAIRQDQGCWQKAVDVFDVEPEDKRQDVEKSLYAGGFLSQHDKAKCEEITQKQGFALDPEVYFEDDRLAQLYFRYRARNFPETLSESEVWRWRDYCVAKFEGSDEFSSNSVPQLQQRIEVLAQEHRNDQKKLAILQALWDWIEQLSS